MGGWFATGWQQIHEVYTDEHESSSVFLMWGVNDTWVTFTSNRLSRHDSWGTEKAAVVLLLLSDTV